MKNLLVVFNQSINKESFIEQNSRLVELAKKNNISVDFKNNAEIYTFLNTNSVKSFYNNLNYDCCLFFDHDTHLARNLELLGMRVLNSSRALLLCENKANMYQEMVANNISIPKTFILPEQSNFNIDLLKDFIEEAITELSFPIVVKNWYGASGEGVFLVKNKNDLYAVIEKFKGKTLLLQEFISESVGTDVRLFVVKDKVIASLRRESVDGSFRSNASLGGKRSQYIPTIMETSLAINAVKAMQCEFGVVDILRSITGSLVCEVNATANIAKFAETTNVDIYDEILKICLNNKKKSKK